MHQTGAYIFVWGPLVFQLLLLSATLKKIKFIIIIIIIIIIINKDKDFFSFFNHLFTTLPRENLDSEDNISIGGDFNCTLTKR